MKKSIKVFLMLNVLLVHGELLISQTFDCEMVVPPFQVSNLTVDIIGNNIYYFDEGENMRICQNPNYTSFPNWMLLGGSSEQNSTIWYPFSNTIRFSKPIQELQFLLLIGGTIYPDIDFGAENFVFEASNCSITLESIYSCNSLIIEDTIYLGVGNTGTGWFSVSFDKPIFEFAISGKGGGNGSAFQICSNSIILAPLWASMSAPPNLCNNGHVQFTAYGTSPPYTFTYSIDGGSPQSIQTTGSNSSESIEVGLGTTFPQTGPYEIELLSITDSDGNTEFLTCNNTAIINVHNEEPPLARSSLRLLLGLYRCKSQPKTKAATQQNMSGSSGASAPLSRPLFSHPPR